MKFTIETTKLNHVLNKVAKGLGKSQMLPVTNYFQFIIEDGDLTVTATDNVNFVSYLLANVNGEDGEVIIKADPLMKLVAKTTAKEMEFDFDDYILEVKGNGKYKIPVYDNDDFPTYDIPSDIEPTELDLFDIKEMLNTNKSAIAVDDTLPCLMGYNVGGDYNITTDGIKMCINEIDLFNENFLMTQELADLVVSMEGEKVNVWKEDNKIIFETDTMTVFGTELEGIDEYPDITPVLELEYENKVTISKSDLLAIIDRLDIFVGEEENYGVFLNFKKDKLVVEDINKNSFEELQVNGGEEISIAVNIHFLKHILNAVKDDVVNLEYAEGFPLKIHEEHVTLFLSTMAVE